MRNEILFGIGGVVLGFGLGYITKHFLVKRKEEERKAQIIESAINDVLAESGLTRETLDFVEEVASDNDEEKTGFEKRREEIRQKLEKNWGGTTNYAEIYTKKGTLQNGEGVPVVKLTEEEIEALVATADVAEGEEEDDERAEDPDDVHMDWDAIDFFERNKGKRPRIVSLDDWQNAPDFIEKEKLQYFVYSNDLVDEDGNVLDAGEEEAMIGDALTKYDFADSQEEVIYVICFAASKIFEIEKVYGEFNEYE